MGERRRVVNRAHTPIFPCRGSGKSAAMSQRPTWDEYFMTITRQVAERSTCLRAKVGAVIVRDRSIVSTGYNGAPAGMPHCIDVGCLVYESKTPTGRHRDELLPDDPRGDQRDRARPRATAIVSRVPTST
jgi:deoxycytidylate deaminase